MKNIENFGLVELSYDEANETQGGSILGFLVSALLGLLIGYIFSPDVEVS